MKKIIIILAIIALSTPGYACGDWVLEHSNIAGGRSGKAVNYCYYQALDGSGKTLSVQLPTHKNCPIILDPCPEEGSKTEIVIRHSFEPIPQEEHGMKKLSMKKLHMKKINEQ